MHYLKNNLKHNCNDSHNNLDLRQKKIKDRVFFVFEILRLFCPFYEDFIKLQYTSSFICLTLVWFLLTLPQFVARDLRCNKVVTAVCNDIKSSSFYNNICHTL